MHDAVCVRVSGQCTTGIALGQLSTAQARMPPLRAYYVPSVQHQSESKKAKCIRMYHVQRVQSRGLHKATAPVKARDNSACQGTISEEDETEMRQRRRLTGGC